MDNRIDKFLEFNGKVIYFLAKDGQYWIALKPICDALGIEFTRQFKNVKSHPVFGKVLAKQPIPTQGGMQKMVCLPERRIYGWIFNIRSESPELVRYQVECCDILFDHFHGKITSRETVIGQKTKAAIEHDKLIAAIRATPEGQRLYEVEKLIRTCNATLRDLDKEIIQNQLPLFS